MVEKGKRRPKTSPMKQLKNINRRNATTIIVALTLTIFAAISYTSVRQKTYDYQQKIRLETELRQIIEDKTTLEKSNAKSQDEAKKNLKKLQEIQKKLEETEKQLQAKKESQKVFASTGYVPTGGSKEQWMTAAGIPQSEWWAVDYIVSRESGWNPCAYYPGGNNCNVTPVNACGLVQQNPCHKIPGDWRDPVAALVWQKNYVVDRYGGYAQAVSYWKIHNHY